jgi:hypothetical protein
VRWQPFLDADLQLALAPVNPVAEKLAETVVAHRQAELQAS